MMELDLHIHTNRYSGCSNIDPVELLKVAKDAGLDVIGLTEHGIRWPDEEILEIINESGVRDLLVFPGQEVACYSMKGAFQGEFLIYGYPKSLGSNKTVEQVISMVHEIGGVVIAAHPFKVADGGYWYYGAGETTCDLPLDALEIEHPSYGEESRKKAKDCMVNMGINGLGSSDAHDLKDVGVCRTIIDTTITTMDDLCRVIRTGKLNPVRNSKVRHI